MRKNITKAPAKAKALAKTKAAAVNPDCDSIIKYFDLFNENEEPLFQVLDMFPIPIEIFAADGTMVYTNQAGLDMLNCKEKSLLIGKYNALHDTVSIDELGYREGFERAFSHEKVIMKDFPAPIQDLVERGVVKDKPFEKAIMDLYTYPIWKSKKLIFVVCVLVVRNLYLGRPDVAKAKEYIDSHWIREFDFHAVAKHVNMSVTQLYGLFHKHMGITPGDYYRNCKIEHLKEKLADKNLSIKEAFAACGEDSRGAYAKIFKKLTGLSPAQFREGLK